MQPLLIIGGHTILWFIFEFIINVIFHGGKMDDYEFTDIIFFTNSCASLVLIICQSIIIHNSSNNIYHCTEQINKMITIFFSLDIAEASIIFLINFIIAVVIIINKIMKYIKNNNKFKRIRMLISVARNTDNNDTRPDGDSLYRINNITNNEIFAFTAAFGTVFGIIFLILYISGTVIESVFFPIYIFGTSDCFEEGSSKIFYTFYLPVICIVGIPIFLSILSIFLTILFYCFMIIKYIFGQIKKCIKITYFVLRNYNNGHDVVEMNNNDHDAVV